MFIVVVGASLKESVTPVWALFGGIAGYMARGFGGDSPEVMNRISRASRFFLGSERGGFRDAVLERRPCEVYVEAQWVLGSAISNREITWCCQGFLSSVQINSPMNGEIKSATPDPGSVSAWGPLARSSAVSLRDPELPYTSDSFWDCLCLGPQAVPCE